MTRVLNVNTTGGLSSFYQLNISHYLGLHSKYLEKLEGLGTATVSIQTQQIIVRVNLHRVKYIRSIMSISWAHIRSNWGLNFLFKGT